MLLENCCSDKWDTFINMDKSWMGTNRTNKSYDDGVVAFIDYAVHNLQKMRNINLRVNKHLLMPCPCTKCLNHIEHKVEEVQFHLFRNGIDLSYIKWTRHGEKDEPSISTPKLVNATKIFVDETDFALDIPIDGPVIVEMVNATKDNFDEDDLGKYASDKFFTELLGLIKKMLPVGNKMVEKTYQTKKVMKLMGSGYKNIHVDNKTHKVYENIPAKVMWYFLIIPRLQRLFKIQSISKDLRWHATRRITDGVLRYPADSQAWRTIDEKSPKIAKDPRNLRLGISADGVDVNTGNRYHSVWPVLTVIYNLPSWLCIKRKFIMLSVLISGYPRNDIDVFLEPLVDDLHTLFEIGVDTYDVSTKDSFNLRVVVLWTINDYPALSTLCGCLYSGFKGCVVCGKDTNCVRLSASSKKSYVGHRRYLPYNYPFRKQKKAFNEQQEFLLAPIPMIKEQIYNENVVESLVGTLLHVLGKTKDGMNARLDLAELGVKPELFAMQEEDKTTLPPAGSEYHKSMETIGIPPDKDETDENEEGKPLSTGKSSEVSTKLFQKAHLRHKQVLKIENPGKRIAFLENEHSKSFAKWLRKEVERELAISKESVSKTVRWISYGPHATVVKYDAYNINGYTFRTKCHDGKVYQNSGVSVEAIDLHISKEVVTIRQAFYYRVLQDTWVLDYHFRQVSLFKCDWVNHRASGVKHDTLGYILVDLNNLGDKVNPFILASQARQVFYVKDQIDKELSIVFKTPPKNYKDTYDKVDEEFSSVIHQRNDNILPRVNQHDLAKTMKAKTWKLQTRETQTRIALLTLTLECLKDEIKKKIGAKKSKTYADKAKGKRRCHVKADHALAFDQSFLGSITCKAFRVFNNRTRIVEENLHISDYGNKVDEDPRQESECKDQEKEDNVNNTNDVNAAGTIRVNVVGANTNNKLPFDPEMSALEDISIFNFSSDHEDDDRMADMNILDTTIQMDAKSDFVYGKIEEEDKTVNLEVQLQALVDGKKVIITESTIRRDLQLEDVEGIDCLPNAAIFEQLTLMGETPLFPTMMVQAQKEIDKAINEEMHDSLERGSTTTTSLDAEQDRDDDELIVESVDVAEPAKEVVDDITLAKALMEIKSVKHKAAKVVIQEQEQGSSKRAGEELEHESTKKQKINDDKETAKLKQLVNIIPDKEGVLIDAIPLAVKPPSIVDWKMIKEGKKTYYKIIRVDGSSKMYLVFSHMLKDFEKEYVQTLWKLVKAKHGSTRPEDGYERVLWVI
nr:hypothetical protein [Tanacetum cinerariifolium]